MSDFKLSSPSAKQKPKKSRTDQISRINEILNAIISGYREVLKGNLAGIYLHGSLAMGCFNFDASDIDFLVVVYDKLTSEEKRKLVMILTEMSETGPGKGFEMSVILDKDAKEFKYPTPFELHYSEELKNRYLNEPEYICGGFEDPDLAAHITVTISRGICLYGIPIVEMFKPVPKEHYIHSIKSDVIFSREQISDNPVYFVLNLCRVLNYLKTGGISSKKEGGEWACEFIPDKYGEIVKAALRKYEDADEAFVFKNEILVEFADYMLGRIKSRNSG